MNNLLDTHTLIWFINGDPDISSKARTEIETNLRGNYVSIASVWEIAIKLSIQKLELDASYESFIGKVYENSFQLIPISPADALLVSSFPFFHRDPFGRMIIAQAQNYSLQILTKDSVFEKYGVSVLW